jgi:hypothetical protein
MGVREPREPARTGSNRREPLEPREPREPARTGSNRANRPFFVAPAQAGAQ